MKTAIYDIESTGAITEWSSIIEIGGVLIDENFNEIDRFNLRGRIPEGEIPQAKALLVNGTTIDQLTKSNLSNYMMLDQVERIFKKWSPAIFMGFSNINFDCEMIRKSFFRNLRYPYITNATPNKRHDALNIVRAAHAVDPKVLKTELNAKGNVSMKLESLSRLQGFDVSGAHTAQFDAINTFKILKLFKQKIKPNLWSSLLRTYSKADTETIFKKEKMITLVEYYYGKNKFHLCAPLHPKYCIHPVYQWGQAVDLRVDPVPLLNMSINELKVEMKKSPKFLRTIRSNKAPVILDAEQGMKFEPYNVMTSDLLNKRAELIRSNEKFSQNILTALRENAEEKEQSKSQEDIYAEESIYTKFTSNKDTVLFPAWHAASWKDKLKLLDKFDDERMRAFGKKIIYQESPDILPKDIFNSVKRGIAKRILSEKKEKWWTVNMCYSEIDTLRDQYDNEKDAETLKTLDSINSYVMSVQQKYENA